MELHLKGSFYLCSEVFLFTCEFLLSIEIVFCSKSRRFCVSGRKTKLAFILERFGGQENMRYLCDISRFRDSLDLIDGKSLRSIIWNLCIEETHFYAANVGVNHNR